MLKNSTESADFSVATLFVLGGGARMVAKFRLRGEQIARTIPNALGRLKEKLRELCPS
jgi:hypothetical protein